MEIVQDGKAREADHRHRKTYLNPGNEEEKQAYEANDAYHDLIHIGPSICSISKKKTQHSIRQQAAMPYATGKNGISSIGDTSPE